MAIWYQNWTKEYWNKSYLYSIFANRNIIMLLYHTLVCFLLLKMGVICTYLTPFFKLRPLYQVKTTSRMLFSNKSMILFTKIKIANNSTRITDDNCLKPSSSKKSYLFFETKQYRQLYHHQINLISTEGLLNERFVNMKLC